MPKFAKGQSPPKHKIDCRCFRCDRVHWVVSPKTIKKIADANRGQIRLNMRGENSPTWKGGFPKCEVCKKSLKSYLAKRCRKHYFSVGEQHWSWKGGKSKCLNCGKETSGYKRSKWCKSCGLKLQRHVGPDWSKHKHPFLGKHHSTESRNKISIKNKGMKMSNETRKRMSIWRREHPDKMGEVGLKGLIKQQSESTSIERKLYEELKNRGLLFEKQYLVNGKFLVDAFIPSLNLIVEADGDYWHSLDRVKKRDKAKNAYLTKCGYKLLRLTETEINNGSFKERMLVS